MAVAKTTEKKRRILWVSVAVLGLVAVAGFIAYDIWLVEQKTQKILGAPGIISTEDNTEKSSEGSETTEVPQDLLASYSVAADAPRALYIDKLGIAARVQQMGINKDNSIQAPVNINDSGWYTGSAKPGEAGAMFIDGHASGSSRMGLFAYLDTLKVGDTLQVEKGDMSRLTYRVVHVETVAVDSVDMSKVLSPYSGVENGLNLMTCTGVWLKDRETLDHRVVVYTEQV